MEQLSFLDLIDSKITIKEFKEYLNKFDDEDNIAFVVVDSKERKHFLSREIYLLAERPAVLFDTYVSEDY
ncbi:hypothetical protein FQB35_15690 (plasmid) [Crassaminicella thermophila]|uniref:Uncharacterized protein n=1 Tax=Crassaminicella thermophila TaxID=2599308 RepID=A0A5C0SJ92_CRATE|nr:hypothetical protein [Crassaminicella thermophila]QEK13766.1 hypothetical protein FQB35_15690 [Crassaminicella thermophila]